MIQTLVTHDEEATVPNPSTEGAWKVIAAWGDGETTDLNTIVAAETWSDLKFTQHILYHNTNRWIKTSATYIALGLLSFLSLAFF